MDVVFGIFIVWLLFEVDFILFILEVFFGDIEIVYEEFKFCVMFVWVYLIFFVSCLFEKGDMVLVVLNLNDLFLGYNIVVVGVLVVCDFFGGDDFICLCLIVVVDVVGFLFRLVFWIDILDVFFLYIFR